MTLRVFFNLFSSLKRHLKFQMELFFNEILGLLSNKQIPFEHREVVLEVIVQLCKDSTFLFDLYINYDCDLQCGNLFERLIEFLYKVRSTSSFSFFFCKTSSLVFSSAHWTCFIELLDCLACARTHHWNADSCIRGTSLDREHDRWSSQLFITSCWCSILSLTLSLPSSFTITKSFSHNQSQTSSTDCLLSFAVVSLLWQLSTFKNKNN
jgi:hypothetical protein